MGVIDNLAGTGRQFQYVPTLRTKAGEAKALDRLQAAAKQRIVPVLQISPSVSLGFAQKMGTAWQNLPIILDGIAQAQTGSNASFLSLYHDLGSSSVKVIPLLQVGVPPGYLAAVQGVTGQYSSGFALRVSISSIPSAQQWLSSIEWTQPGAVDLIIDCGHVAEIDPALLASAVSSALQSSASALSTWRSVTLSASSAPKDASSLNQGMNLVPRRDWQLWRAISPAFPQLHFGDYGIAHRDPSEPPGFAMANATVTPRYALDDAWLIRKGRSTQGKNGQPMTAQYHGHAQALFAHPDFNCVPGCWADSEISRIAAQGGIGKSGSRETWVGYGLNRHMSLVSNLLP